MIKANGIKEDEKMQANEKNRIIDKEFRESDGEKRENIFKRLGSLIRSKLSGKGEREVRTRLRLIVTFMLTVGASFLLSTAELPFSTFPLVIALICSSRRHIPAVVIGVALSLFSGTPTIYAYVAVAVLFIRVLTVLMPLIFSDGFFPSRTKSREIIPHKSDALDEKRDERGENYIVEAISRMFCEKLYSRALCSAVGGAICGVVLLFGSGFSLYSALATLVLTIGAPLATLAFGGALGEELEGDRYRLIAFGSIFFFAVYGAADKSVLGMPLAPCIATALTLYVCSGSGIIRGLATAFVCGIAFDLTYLPLLVLSAVVFCLVSAVRRNAGVAVVSGMILLWCYYIGGTAGLVGVLPPMLLAIPVYMLADKYREMMNAPFGRAAAEGIYFAAAVTEQNKNAAVKERLNVLSDTFSSLSETFFKLSNRFRRSDLLGIRKIADSSFEKVCEGCRERERCWGADIEVTLEAVKCVSSELYNKGSINSEALPESFRASCKRSERLVSDINEATREATERMISGGRANFFASNYDDITAILKDALSVDSEEYECDLALGERIFEYLYSGGMSVKGVVVYGKRCIHVIAKGLSGIDCLSAERAEEICRRVSEMVGAALTLPVIEVGQDGNVMLMYSRPSVKASCAHGRLSGSGREWSSRDRGQNEYIDLFDSDESLCGDMTEAFITDNSYFYSLISDGMGSGAQAAYTSGVCAMFVEKMLEAGNRADITIRMLNNVIRSENMGCGDECSATVDLLELDLMSGGAAFIKSGAAPTYIAREGTVYKISSRTMPVGIIKDADARITKFDTKKGDIIVMMSDGCCHDSEDCPWLVEFLCSYMKRTRQTVQVGEEICESLKDEILKEAVINLPEGVERDDISVSVIVVG